jgi:hypothetical protein
MVANVPKGINPEVVFFGVVLQFAENRDTIIIFFELIDLRINDPPKPAYQWPM